MLHPDLPDDSISNCETCMQRLLDVRRPTGKRERCVHHVIAIIVRAIEEGTSMGADDMELSGKEVRNWASTHLKGFRVQ